MKVYVLVKLAEAVDLDDKVLGVFASLPDAERGLLADSVTWTPGWWGGHNCWNGRAGGGAVSWTIEEHELQGDPLNEHQWDRHGARFVGWPNGMEWRTDRPEGEGWYWSDTIGWHREDEPPAAPDPAKAARKILFTKYGER